MTTEPLVQVVVLTYNDPPAVRRCLESLGASTYRRTAVTVVDNASEDDTVAAAQRACPSAEIIVNAANLGFGAGCNVGITRALDSGSDFVLLLNQDTAVAADMIASLVTAAHKWPQAGILAPKTYYMRQSPDGRSRLFYTGSWQRRLPLRQRIPGMGRADDGSHDIPLATEYAWGHGMLLRSTMLREIGLFDPAFFMYYEDLDLCRRAANAGFEVWYEPSAVMWHDTPDGPRATESEAWRWHHKVRSMTAFHRKHYGHRRGDLLTILTVADEAAHLLWQGHRLAARHLVTAWFRSVIESPAWR